MRRLGALTCTVALGLVAAAPAKAVVTVGSDLAASPTGTLDCPSHCTASQVNVPPSSQASGGVSAPIDGLVVRWRIKAGTSVTPVAFRVTRPSAAYRSVGAGTGPTVTPTANATTTYSIAMPVQAGDYIGIDCCLAGANFAASTPGASYTTWTPRLADGEQRVPSSLPEGEVLINADIEPDCDGDLRGDETQDADVFGSGCTPKARTLSLNAAKSKVERGKKVRFSGRLGSSDSRCVSGQTVELQRRARGAVGFDAIDQVNTRHDGSFAAKAKVKKTFAYRAQVIETGGCGAQVSGTETVKVKKSGRGARRAKRRCAAVEAPNSARRGSCRGRSAACASTAAT